MTFSALSHVQFIDQKKHINSENIISVFIPSPVGDLWAHLSDDAVVSLLPADYASLAFKNSPSSNVISSDQNKIQQQLIAELGEYFDGKRQSFDVPVKAFGSAFEIESWKALCQIPYGETRSYQDQACQINNPLAYRAVANANGKNKMIILIPCHRVIRSGGHLGGYRCGIDVKKTLLTLESSHIN